MRRSLILAGALLLALAGCGDSAKADDSVTLKVGQTGWAQSAAALKVAHLDDTPYKIQWPVFSGGDKQMEALRANAIDVGQASEIPPIFAAAAGEPNFKVVAVQKSTTLQQEVVVGKSSPITSIAQLKGKKVGYVPNTTAHYFLYKLLVQAGLTWQDITPAPLAPKDGVAALGSGSIDALASYGNSIITIHQNGGKTIGSGRDILSGNFQWVARDDVIAGTAEKGALVDLIARLNKAYAYIRGGHEQEYAQAISDGTHQPVADALTQLQAQEQQRPTTFGPTDATAIVSQQQVADAFTTLGAIPSKLDVATFWSDRLNADLSAALTKGTS